MTGWPRGASSVASSLNSVGTVGSVVTVRHQGRFGPEPGRTGVSTLMDEAPAMDSIKSSSGLCLRE